MAVVPAGVHGAGNFAREPQRSGHMIRSRRFRHQHAVNIKAKDRPGRPVLNSATAPV